MIDGLALAGYGWLWLAGVEDSRRGRESGDLRGATMRNAAAH